LRILIGVHHLPPHYQGGAEKIALLTARALAGRGHEIYMFAVERIDYKGSKKVYWEDEVSNGIIIRRIFFDGSSSFAPNAAEFNNPFVRSAFKEALEEFKPQLFYLIGGYLLSGSVIEEAFDKSIPVIVKITDFWYLCPRITMLRTDGTVSGLPINPNRCARCVGEEKRRYRIPGRIFPSIMDLFWRVENKNVSYFQERNKYLSTVMQKVEVFISESKFLKNMYVEGGINEKKIIQIRQGKDFNYLTHADLEKTKSDTLRVAYFGQITKHKGVHILIEAIKKIPSDKVNLCIHGDDTAFPAYTHSLKRMIGNDKRIELCKPFSTVKEQTKLFKEIDVLVVPTIGNENSPNVVLEAQLHHTPVIASDFAGLPEMIEDGKNGLLFQRADPDDLSKKIKGLLDEPEKLEYLKNHSGFGIRTIKEEMDLLEDLFHKYVNEPKSRDQ